MASSISWPASMPKPLQETFSMQPEDRRVASSAVGTSFAKGFGGDMCSADCTLLLSPAQSLWLEAFERDTLVHGTRWFSFPVWYAGQVHWEDCRFKTRPKAGRIVGKHTSYQFALHVRRRSSLSAEVSLTPPVSWPEWMPAPQGNSWEFQPEDLREATETEVGAILRPQFDSDMVVASCTLVLNQAQALWFETFEREAVQEGAWFAMPVWYGGSLRSGVCMVKDRPKWTAKGKNTTYQFSVLVQRRSLT